MTSYTLAMRDVPLFYLSLNMALVVSRSDGKRNRGVLFHRESREEVGGGLGEVFHCKARLIVLGLAHCCASTGKPFGDLSLEFRGEGCG